jgi:curved DNA-binding protein CbpA
VLGVGVDASDEQIKDAYRAKARFSHPDMGGNEEEFKMVNESNEILSNPIRRKHYDETGETAEQDPEAAKRMAFRDFMQIFANVAASGVQPVVSNVRSTVINERLKLTKKRQEFTLVVERMRAALKKLTFKEGKDREDFLFAGIELSISDNMQQVTAIDKALEHLDRVLGICEWYQEQIDQPATTPFGSVQGGRATYTSWRTTTT